jgi:HPt (histidine-containing phosphotransfer) domain-containing protein
VAITASHAGDKQSRDEAGMNDCLSKPFTMEELAVMLSKWLPQSKHSLPLMAASSGDPTSLEHKPSSSVLDLKKLQRTFGKDGCIEIIRTFADSTSTILDDIKKAREEQEKDRVKFLCHRLKGAASMACMRDLSRTSAMLEEAGSKAEWEEIDRLLSTLDLQMQKATAALKSALSELKN